MGSANQHRMFFKKSKKPWLLLLFLGFVECMDLIGLLLGFIEIAWFFMAFFEKEVGFRAHA